MYVCMYGWMDGWMYGCKDVRMGPGGYYIYIYITEEASIPPYLLFRNPNS